MGTMSARLRQRLRYISEFAGNVSHEFKTPVSSLRGTVELLRDDDDMPPEQRARFLENALSDLDRLSRLVGGLLRLARAEEGGARAVFSLDDVVADVCARHRDGGGDVSHSGAAARVDANREQIDSAVGNLVENALRHGGPDVKVQVVGFTDGAWTGVDVIDDGPGISPANLPKVFDRFFTTDRAKGGTGLGLALVRAVMEAHGGRVEVESVLGRTRLRVVLPRL
jgi:signal transduction histidine kinase